MPTSGAGAGYTLTKVNARCAYLNTQNGTTATITLLELNSARTDIVTRASTTTTTAPNNNTLESDAITACFQPNPVRVGFMAFDGAADDPNVGTALLTLPPPAGVAKSTVAISTTVAVATHGYDNSATGLTAAQKYYADIGGLLTTENNELPDKVGVTKDTGEFILKSW